MRLPNAHLAQVEREKITGYLLAEDPVHSRGKSLFFSSFGFRADHWEAFAAALSTQGGSQDVAEVEGTPFGPRYSVDGILETPDGRNPLVTTVWQVDRGEIHPRLITAYRYRRRG